MEPTPLPPIAQLQEFLQILVRLRKDCPWDRAQTHESLQHSFIEEVYEVIEAIDHSRWEDLRNELGDVLLHIGLQAEIAKENGEFLLADVVSHINEKLKRRHPHIFGEGLEPDLQAQKRNWEKIKLSEGRMSVVDGVPNHMPALLRALRLQEKASKIGFDWKEQNLVWQKVAEEVHELEDAHNHQDQEKLEEEFGDLLFALVNYSRFIHVNPETALRQSCEKFLRRFKYVEEQIIRSGGSLYDTSLETMDGYWEEAKMKGL